jgi:hypothetical protein
VRQANALRRQTNVSRSGDSSATRLSGLPLALAASQAIGCLVCVAAYAAAGLHVVWTSVPVALPLIGIALAIWWATRSETALAVALLISCSALVLLLQYPALALGRPMVDGVLLRADALLGVSVPVLTAWTITHTSLLGCLRAAYDIFAVELLAAIGIIAARRDRAALWEFVTEYHVCLGVAIAACALWPATEPWALWHLPDLTNQSRAVAQIAGFHSGALRVVNLNEPAGLVASPAFHVAGAWMAAWAVRRSRLAFWTLCGLNIALTAATVLLGIHYVVDGLAGFALLLASIALYRAPALWRARAPDGMASRLRNQEPSSASFA